MILPIQITFRNMNHSDAVEAKIREEAAKLESFYDGIMSCRVMAEIPHHHHQRGNPFHIRIDLSVPGGELVVQHEPTLHSSMQKVEEDRITKEKEAQAAHKDIYVAIRDAFKAARRKLQDYARQQRGQVKAHEPTNVAHVSRLFQDEGYGFLETADGREIYFHKNSVLDGGFERMEVGAEARFAEEQGVKGPQASTVRLGHKRRGA